MLFTYHICIYHRHMSYMENVQKLQENLNVSWFGGYLVGIWRAFFHDFSMWDVLWWILGCTLAALGRYSAPGSGSGRPLGAEREPMASFSDRYPTRRSKRELGLGALKYAFYISYMYICIYEGQGRGFWLWTVGSGLWEVGSG